MADLIADPFRAARLILQLRRQGIRDDAVLSAMETVDRSAFVDASLRKLAQEDAILPLPCGQTLPKPIVIAQLLGALKAHAGQGERHLLIGGGSGYVGALLAQIARHVWMVERYGGLVETARKKLDAFKVRNVDIRQGDGLAGWREHGPFDRILLAGAVKEIPDVLLGQLARGGALVAPVIKPDGKQVVRRLTKDGSRADSPLAEPVTPLVEGVSAAL